MRVGDCLCLMWSKFKSPFHLGQQQITFYIWFLITKSLLNKKASIYVYSILFGIVCITIEKNQYFEKSSTFSIKLFKIIATVLSFTFVIGYIIFAFLCCTKFDCNETYDFISCLPVSIIRTETLCWTKTHFSMA